MKKTIKVKRKKKGKMKSKNKEARDVCIIMFRQYLNRNYLMLLNWGYYKLSKEREKERKSQNREKLLSKG